MLQESEIYWCLGVLNVFFSSWLAGAYPWTYWIVHFFKMGYLLVVRVYKFSQNKKIFWLCDFCYVVNYFIFLYYLLSLSFNKNNAFKQLSYYIFRILFTCTVGPLALAIPAFRNSLVFHNLDQITILALHWSPNIAFWGLRWYLNDVEKTFPNVFHVGCNEPNAPIQQLLFYDDNVCKGTFVELWVYPLVAYIVCYSIPYALWFFILGKQYLEDNHYNTMYEDMKDKPPMKNLLSIGGDNYKELKYSIVHGCATGIAFFLGPLFWHSFALHTSFLGIILLYAIMNGSTYYMRVFVKHEAKAIVEKERQKALEGKGKDKDGKDTNADIEIGDRSTELTTLKDDKDNQ